jgi:hypothetical protein
MTKNLFVIMRLLVIILSITVSKNVQIETP